MDTKKLNWSKIAGYLFSFAALCWILMAFIGDDAILEITIGAVCLVAGVLYFLNNSSEKINNGNKSVSDLT